MVPAEYSNFFLGSAGAAAALIGLLFVVVAIDPKRTIGADAPIARRAIAGSAFTALLDAFFVSLGSLLPGYNLGGFALVMSLVGLLNTFTLVVRMVRQRDNVAVLVQRVSLVLASFIIYGLECSNGLGLINNGNDHRYVFTLSILIITIYGVALSRAWELLGADESGLRGLIDVLREPRPPKNAPSDVPSSSI
jgi:hypothetical protein